MTDATQPTAQDEVVELLADSSGSTRPTRPIPNDPPRSGSPPSWTRSASSRRSSRRRKGRASTIARIEGSDSSRAPLLIHGHLDVVPADASEWSVDPFSGEIKDGYIWGRGAIDMKDMDAMTLALVREWARTGTKPPRDIVLAFVSDEEAGGRLGRALPGRQPRRPVRRLHRGDQRGRRVQHLAQRVRSRLPRADRREGHQLAAADRRPARPGTARWCTTTTPSPGSPRPSRGSARTSGRSSSPTRCARRSPG